MEMLCVTDVVGVARSMCWECQRIKRFFKYIRYCYCQSCAALLLINHWSNIGMHPFRDTLRWIAAKFVVALYGAGQRTAQWNNGSKRIVRVRSDKIRYAEQTYRITFSSSYFSLRLHIAREQPAGPFSRITFDRLSPYHSSSGRVETSLELVYGCAVDVTKT